MRLRLFEIHEQPWFPQFLRDQFVDSLQMILEVTNAYHPIAPLLPEHLNECGADRVVDLCSGAGGPWPACCHPEMRQFFGNIFGLSCVCISDCRTEGN